MAWNPSPEVAIARGAAKQLGADRVVVVFTRPDGTFGYASFGNTMALCGLAKLWGDRLFEASQEYFEREAAELTPPAKREAM